MRLISDNIKVELHKESPCRVLVASLAASLKYNTYSLMETTIDFKTWEIREILAHLMSQPTSWN